MKLNRHKLVQTVVLMVLLSSMFGIASAAPPDASGVAAWWNSVLQLFGGAAPTKPEDQKVCAQQCQIVLDLKLADCNRQRGAAGANPPIQAPTACLFRHVDDFETCREQCGLPVPNAFKARTRRVPGNPGAG